MKLHNKSGFIYLYKTFRSGAILFRYQSILVYLQEDSLLHWSN